MNKFLAVLTLKRTILCIVSYLFICFCIYGNDNEYNTPRQIPDAPELRKQTVEAWLYGSSDTPANCFSVGHDPAGKAWQIDFSFSDGNSVYRITPEYNGFFYEDTPGTWIITASFFEQKILSAELIADSMNKSSIYFTADGNQTIIDIVIYDAYFANDLSIAVPIEKICTYSLQLIKEMTATLIYWRYIEPNPVLYDNNRILVSQIRKNIGQLQYSDDGALNEIGEFVHIEDERPMETDEKGVNCSGFAKWIVDALIRPITGQGLFIKPLKTIALGGSGKDTLFKETGAPQGYSRQYTPESDAFFGLYWTRNLAAAAASVLCGRDLTPITAGVDVTAKPFGSIQPSETSKKVREMATGYLKNAGFPIHEMMPLLYSLAIDEPDTIYLASVNREVKDGSTVLRKHNHIAVLIPWFDKKGTFALSIFESAQETDPDVFQKVNSGSFIHLSRIHTPRQIYFSEVLP